MCEQSGHALLEISSAHGGLTPTWNGAGLSAPSWHSHWELPDLNTTTASSFQGHCLEGQTTNTNTRYSTVNLHTFSSTNTISTNIYINKQLQMGTNT